MIKEVTLGQAFLSVVSALLSWLVSWLFLEELRKTARNVCENSPSPCRDMNPGLMNMKQECQPIDCNVPLQRETVSLEYPLLESQQAEDRCLIYLQTNNFSDLMLYLTLDPRRVWFKWSFTHYFFKRQCNVCHNHWIWILAAMTVSTLWRHSTHCLTSLLLNAPEGRQKKTCFQFQRF
jgi:hypothetical protein